MAREMKLPDLGEDIEAGIVLNILVEPGDVIEEDQVVLELETDKATSEVPADFSGVVQDIQVSEGAEIKGGQTILTYEPREEEGAEEEGAEEEKKEKEEEEGEARGREGRNGRAREAEEEVDEADKPEEREERREGEERREREEAQAGEETRERKAPRREEKKEKKREERRTRRDEPLAASPAVRGLARELGVSVDEVVGTGPGGRIGADDVKAHVRSLLEEARKSAREKSRGLPDFGAFGAVEVVGMSAIRRAVAKNVATSWSRIPHVSQFDEADITELGRFQERFRDEVEEAGGKLTLTAILLKVLALALRKFPEFNASLDIERGELILKDYVHIGVAVDTEDGLLVPVLRDVDKKGLVQVSAELVELSGKARARKVSREDLTGSSFSLTNLGAFGTTHFTPIIGWPAVAILAVGKATMKPVFDGSEFRPRMMMPLGITYDHRAVDGADAAKFLRWIAQTLEEPLRMTMVASDSLGRGEAHG